MCTRSRNHSQQERPTHWSAFLHSENLLRVILCFRWSRRGRESGRSGRPACSVKNDTKPPKHPALMPPGACAGSEGCLAQTEAPAAPLPGSSRTCEKRRGTRCAGGGGIGLMDPGSRCREACILEYLGASRSRCRGVHSFRTSFLWYQARGRGKGHDQHGYQHAGYRHL